jgi:hypothetical protein
MSLTRLAPFLVTWGKLTLVLALFIFAYCAQLEHELIGGDGPLPSAAASSEQREKELTQWFERVRRRGAIPGIRDRWAAVGFCLFCSGVGLWGGGALLGRYAARRSEHRTEEKASTQS